MSASGRNCGAPKDFDAMFGVRTVIDEFANAALGHSPLDQDDLTRIAAAELIRRIEADILSQRAFLKP
jgi:hypothetical protein